MDAALRTVLEDCLGVRSGENVMVLTDPGKQTIGMALVKRARDLGADAVLVEMPERQTHGTEPPPHVAAAMLACDVLLAPTTKSVSHTEARRAACARGVRVATMPNITEDMLERTMSDDYAEVRRRSRALAEILSSGTDVRITTPGGTDVSFAIGGRTGIADDGDLRASGAFGNLPAGEGFIAPLEGTTEGRIAFDGSIWPVGLLKSPLFVQVENGYAVDFSGDEAERFKSALEPYGREAFAVAELGLGTNAAAQLTGNVLEDEKILGTAHVAFGDNHSFGGVIRVSSHQDGVMLEPTVMIDDQTVVESGRLLL